MVVVRISPSMVPATVTLTETNSARKICALSFHINLYASREKESGMNRYPYCAMELSDEIDIINTKITGVIHIAARIMNKILKMRLVPHLILFR
jgi:hypothetical protein